MRVLFVHKSMNMGGIEKSLLSLTNELVDKHEVNVFLLNDTFGKEYFNKKVKFLESKKTLRLLNPQKSYSKIKKSRLNFIKKIVTFFGVRNFMEMLFAREKVVNDFYDTAIAFHGEDYVACYQVSKKIEAKKKIVFLHFDTSRVKIKKRVLNLYKHFNKIICVSKGCADAFKAKYPKLADRVDFIYNICDEKSVKEQAVECEILYPKNCLNIVSVSRLSKEKAHLRSLNIFKRLRDEGYKFCWHIVGDGDTREEIEQFVQKNNMTECVKIYGNQQNPYPYVKSADLFYLGSLHESFGIALIEAMFLQLPVLTTKTISAEEVIGKNGIVCENDEESIIKELRDIMSNRNILLNFKENLKTYKFDKEQIVEKFNRL